jgi:hypothetical protein
MEIYVIRLFGSEEGSPEGWYRFESCETSDSSEEHVRLEGAV